MEYEVTLRITGLSRQQADEITQSLAELYWHAMIDAQGCYLGNGATVTGPDTTCVVDREGVRLEERK